MSVDLKAWIGRQEERRERDVRGQPDIGRTHTDHPEGRAADPDALPDRLPGVAREQLSDRPRPEYHDLRLRPLLLLVEERADDQVEIGDIRVVRGGAGDPRAVADLTLLLQQRAARDQRDDARDVRGRGAVRVKVRVRFPG